MEHHTEVTFEEKPAKIGGKPVRYRPDLKLALNCLVFIFKILMLLTGISTIKDCPSKPIVPVYAALAGGIGVLARILAIANHNRKVVAVDRTVYALRILEFIWMIFGWYFVFSIFQPNYEPYFGPYCERAVYSTIMAFVIIQALYFILVITSIATKSTLNAW